MTATTRDVQHASAVCVMATGLAVALLLGVRAQALALDTGDLTVVIEILAYVAAGAACLYRFRCRRLATILLAWTAMLGVIVLALLETALLATVSRPYADPLFAGADTVLAPWLDWQALASWFAAHPFFSWLCELAYHSIQWQPFALIAALCATRRPADAWRFIGTWTLSLMICEMVFVFYPGIGAYAYHHVDAALTSPTSQTVSAGQLRILTKLRAPSLALIDNSCIGGIITFPSFHAAASALLARGYWRIPGLRWPFAALNLAMLATAIPMGGHYVIDLVAGLTVAALAIAIFEAPALEWRGRGRLGWPRRPAWSRAETLPAG